MSDKPSGEKTEQPTPKRLRDARQKGQVVRSTDVVTTISTIFVFSAISLTLSNMVRYLSNFFIKVFQLIEDPSSTAVIRCFSLASKYLLQCIIPICATAVLGVIVASIGQFGFLFTFQSMKPDISKINPISGMKKIFSSKTLIELLKSVIKLSVFAILLFFIIKGALGSLVTLPFTTIFNEMDVVKPMLIHFIVSFLAVYVIIAIIDYLVQKQLLTKDLMMTKDEVKREFHDTEGDPMIKGNRRRIQREMIFEDTSTATKKSTVLVTNPTHYAAAIYYERGKTRLPILRAKGSGFIALRMISVARQENVPIIENIPLARGLYHQLEVNDIIPGEFLGAVTEILRWVRTLPPRVATT